MNESQSAPEESSSPPAEANTRSTSVPSSVPHLLQKSMKWGSDLREFIALLLFVGSIIGIERSRPTVEVTLQTERYPAPVQTGALQAKVAADFSAAQKKTAESSSPGARAMAMKPVAPLSCEQDRPCAEKLFSAIDKYANAFQEVTYLRIKNLSDDAIENVDLRVESVQSFVDYGVRSDSAEVTDVLTKSPDDFVTHDAKSGIVSIKGVRVLPPRSSTEVVIWGEIGGNGPSVQCSSGPRCEVVAIELASGMEAVVVRNLGPIVAVVLTGALLMGLTRSRRRTS